MTSKLFVEELSTPGIALAPLNQSLHIGTVVKAIVYDTRNDYMAGEWRKRCQDKSWYTETLGGDRWIGQQATIAAAWTAAGSATGAVFQASATAGPITIGKYYSANSATTVTEVFRGITREFPAVAGIVAESARVVIYDLNNGGAMFMVFKGVASSTSLLGYDVGTHPVTCVAAMNGAIAVGGNASAVVVVSFASDSAVFRSIGNSGRLPQNVAARNTGGSSAADLTNIVNSTVNDVAITVLDNAPIDPQTGLPVPTIFVGTAGGLSTIVNTGAVINSTATTSVIKVVADGKKLTSIRSDGTVCAYNDVTTMPVVPSTTYTASSIPATLGAVSGVSVGKAKYLGSSAGVTVLYDNPADPAKGMTARITDNSNSGIMVGDSRLATLCDTVAETIVGSDVIAGTTYNVSGRVSAYTYANGANSASLSWDGVSADGFLSLAIAGLIIGKSYVATFTASNAYTSGAPSSYRANVQNSGGNVLGQADVALVGTTAPQTIHFVATSLTGFLYLYSKYAGSLAYSAISVKLAEPDRSGKAQGLIVNGTLTKAAVASGASLVGYGGSGVANPFTTTSPLTQPYSANHNYSTTGFSGALWLKEAPNSAIEYILNRDSLTSAQAIRLWVSVAGFLVFELYDGTTTRTATGTVAVDDSTWKLVQFDYLAGTLNIYVNGTLYATATGAALLTLSNTAALLQIGLKVDGTLPLTSGSVALFRMSATIPSQDQREFIYRTELPLFSPGAKCTIDGTSPAVTALAYDDSTDLLHVGTSRGRSGFKDLLRVDSEATTTGSITSLSAQGGTILTGGTSVKLYTPAKYLRDELQRQSEAKSALGRIPVFFDHDAVTSQTAFVLPAGYTAKAVYSAGLLQREGTTKAYTKNTDGFKETITFAVAPGNTVFVSIMAVRA